MTCSECQAQIFDGELRPEATTHLAGCEECGALDREVRLNAAALAEMRDIVVPVRAPKRQWPGYVALAAAAMLALAVGLYDDKPLIPEPSAPRLPEMPRIVEAVVPIPPLVLPGPPPARRVLAAKPAPPTKAEEPLLVKFLTDDPDVVIYWLIDPVQGEQAL